MRHILIVNGPNLNLTGLRNQSVYGKETLADIELWLLKEAERLGVSLTFSQSNSEGAIVDAIQSVRTSFDGCVLNAGAYTHYSYAIRDAIEAAEKPVIEVHLSNIYTREDFRKKSVLSEVCRGVIAGFGKQGYGLAVRALAEMC